MTVCPVSPARPPRQIRMLPLLGALLLVTPAWAAPGWASARALPLAQSTPAPSTLAAPAIPTVQLPSADSAGAPSRTGPTDAAELEAFLDGVMKIQLKAHNSAGAVVTVVKDGEVFFAKGYGYADREARRRVDPQATLFRIGSITKLFVWTSVMQLVEQGSLDLDADVNQYLKDFQIPATYLEPVTLRHILTHSAGFEDWVVKLFGKDTTDLAPLGEILAHQLPTRVRPPGQVSSYSNHATGMAAYIVEQVSGMAWDRFIQERILAPLGMERFSVAQPLPASLAGDMSKGYSGSLPLLEEEDFEYVPLYPVGAAAASGEAMARFMIAHLQLGRYGDARILEEETARRMHSELFRMAPEVNAMAHGFYEMSANGVRIIGHGGDTFWFHSQLALFPDQGLGVFVSFNSQEGGSATGEFVNAFVDRYFPAEEVTATPPEDFADRAERFTGRYRANRFSHSTLAKVAALGTVSVKATGEGTLRALQSEWIEVAPLTFAEKHGDRTLVFREGENGTATHFFLAQTPVVAFERVPWQEGTVLNLLLAAFAGVMVVGTLAAWPLGWGVRRWYGVGAAELVRIPGGARSTLRMAAASFLAFALGMGTALADPTAIAVEIPAGLPVILFFPMLGAAFTAASFVYAVRLVGRREGRPVVRVAYALAVLSFLTLLWQMEVWNLLGWRY